MSNLYWLQTASCTIHGLPTVARVSNVYRPLRSDFVCDFFFFSSRTKVRCGPWLPIQSSSLHKGFLPLPACFLFILYLNPLQTRPFLFYMVLVRGLISINICNIKWHSKIYSSPCTSRRYHDSTEPKFRNPKEVPYLLVQLLLRQLLILQKDELKQYEGKWHWHNKDKQCEWKPLWYGYVQHIDFSPSTFTVMNVPSNFFLQLRRPATALSRKCLHHLTTAKDFKSF
jgi:hypothetical protein